MPRLIRSRMNILVITALCLTLPCALGEDGGGDPPLKPFVAGDGAWNFDCGFFNKQLSLDVSNRGLHDIVTFLPSVGSAGGSLSIETSADDAGQLQVSEVYTYPSDTRAKPATKDAAPPTARVYKVVETKVGETVITTLVGKRGRDHADYLHLVPTAPVEGLQWHWNTEESTFVTGPPPEGATFNAHGKIVSTAEDVPENSLSTRKCVHIEIEMDGIATHWWFNKDKGLIRFGGENMGASRDALAKTDETETPPTILPMDQVVYFRTN